jgi:hypothetical protein
MHRAAEGAGIVQDAVFRGRALRMGTIGQAERTRHDQEAVKAEKQRGRAHAVHEPCLKS